tara:strand:+ start:12395 stop:13498 length:1104 start_codon:yes stop_codon:yes gene_type:complete
MYVISEGGVEIRVPSMSVSGKTKDVFFNPEMELNRDLTIAVLRAYKQEGMETYLDANAATGIRGTRAALDGWKVTLVDISPEAVELCKLNLSINNLSGEVHHNDVNIELRSKRYDVVDVDPFGSPISFLDSAFRGARKLLCVTATDTAPLCGAHLQAGIRRYSSVPKKTEYHAEIGIRNLLSSMARWGARYDIGINPIFCHSTRHYYRVYVEIDRRASKANEALEELGYIHHCSSCLYREVQLGLLSFPILSCPSCGGKKVITSGPIWLGKTHDKDFISKARSHVTEEMGMGSRVERIFSRVAEELEVPTHYDQHKLCRLWGLPAPSMEIFIGQIVDAGFEISRTHYGGTTFKTNATISEIYEIAND